MKKIISNMKQLRSYWNYFRFFRDEVSLLKLIKTGIFYIVEKKLKNGYSFGLNSIIFEVTSRCRLGCTFCYYNDMKNRKVEELTLEEIEQFLDQLKPDTSMVLSGGEPFERKDMDDIIKAVKIRKLPCTIVTNGFALNEKNIETILTQGVESVIVSLHGPEEIHNSITGNRTAFKNALWTLRQLTHDKKRKTKVIINAVISPETISCLDDLMEIAKKCEVDLVKFEHLHFTKEKETNKAYTTYTTKDPSVDAAKLYDKLCLYSSQSIPVIVKPNLTKKEFMKWYTTFDHLERSCPFVYHSMILSSDGNIYPCQHMYESMGNIKTELLKDIWNNEKFRSFRKKIHKNPKQMCYRCCKI